MFILYTHNFIIRFSPHGSWEEEKKREENQTDGKKNVGKLYINCRMSNIKQRKLLLWAMCIVYHIQEQQ